MGLFSSLYRNGLWVGPPAFALGVLSLALLVADIARVVRAARIASLPLQGAPAVDFAEAGRVVMCLEGPLGNRGFARLDFDLTGPGGSPVPGRRVWFRTVASGFFRARMAYKTYDIPAPGRYVLRVRGLEPGRPGSDALAVVFMRPYLGASVIRIVGILLAAALLVGSVVLFFLRLLGKGPAPP